MNSHTLRSTIAAGACAVLGISLSVALGVAPRVAGDDHNVRLVSATGTTSDAALSQLLYPTAPSRVQAPYQAVQAAPVNHAVSAQPHATTHAVRSVSAHAGAAHVVSAVAASATTKHPAATHKKHHKHHKHKTHKKHHKGAIKSAPKHAARITPTNTAVSNAIAGLKKYVHTPSSINASEVAQFGDAVCSAFDSNTSYAHVKAEIMDKVKQIPFTTVAAGAADYVVKTAVKLYCPGYSSRTA
jgi:hypothetical protein